MRRLSRLVSALWFAATAAAASSRITVPDTVMVGGEFDYTVLRGDSLSAIAARFAVSPKAVAARNRLASTKKLIPGQVLRIDNRHIVPGALEDGILINLPQRLLFLFEDGHVVAWYPIAIGRADWQTPTGSYEIVTKEKNPVWEVPPSIQGEMRRKGERVRAVVLPGPDNPLGNYWLGLSLSCCGIHGTNAPQSIYTFQTHGCIRLGPQNAAELFSRVSVALSVEIVYEPVLVARDEYGTVFLEVHRDVYGRIDGNFERATSVAESRGFRSALKSPRWDETVRGEAGVALPLRLDGRRAGGADPGRPIVTSRFQ